MYAVAVALISYGMWWWMGRQAERIDSGLVSEIDALRAEIGDAIGGAGPDRWLTIVFTADPVHL